MPWCPKCKNEYREGILTCSSCGVDLVDELEVSNKRPVMFGDQDQMELVKEFLEYNKISDLEVVYDKNDSVYELYVPNSKYEEASKLIKVFVAQELSRAEEEDEEEIPETFETKQYVNSADWAEENKSSAWMLLLVGIGGLIIVLLGILGVIPLRLGNQFLFYGVLSAIFILFIVMGIVSMKNAKIFAGKAETENTIKNEIINWINSELTSETIDSSITDSINLTDEELYFKRIEKLNELINNKFMNLDKMFLEHFIDEELYDSIFTK